MKILIVILYNDTAVTNIELFALTQKKIRLSSNLCQVSCMSFEMFLPFSSSRTAMFSVFSVLTVPLCIAAPPFSFSQTHELE